MTMRLLLMRHEWLGWLGINFVRLQTGERDTLMSQYEFSNEQNTLIGSLSYKVRFVGMFFVALGVLNFLVSILVIVAIYRNHIPKEWVDQLPEDVKAQAEKIPSDKIPANNQLWGTAINTAVIGLFYLLMGVWTRAAGASFEQIVTTQGSDISHLMNALSSLHSMYALFYTLLVITLVFMLVGIGVTLYSRFAT